MYQFFTEKKQVCGETIRITGPDAVHIGNVLRMKPGERIRISVSDGRSYFCRIESIRPGEAAARIEEEDTAGTELPCRIVLFQGLPKKDKMELIIRKAVELGASEIVPVAMQRSIVRLDEKKAQAKVLRWQAIAESAAKQSKRTIIPKIGFPVSWNEAKQAAEGLDLVLVPYENERGMEHTRSVCKSIVPGQAVGIIVGPEGGFSEEEIESLPPKMQRISLGRRILRTETAGMAVLSMLLYELEP